MHGKISYFGTDGIRGLVGEIPITPDWLLKLGWAIGKALQLQNHSKVLIGKDTRISGYMLESALEAGLSSAGADIGLLGPMPTPAIAFLTKNLQAGAGIVISASHNPYYDNGIKIFDYQGNKLSQQVEAKIQYYLKQKLKIVPNNSLGKAKRILDAEDKYVAFCKRNVAKNLSLNSYKIVLDCANGANYKIAPRIFTELGANLELLGINPNGLNINANCGSTALNGLIKKVKSTKADLGIAFDGDGDRLIMIDEQGNIVDGDQILFILAKSYKQSAGIVGTIMSNLGLEKAVNAIGLDFIRTKVGDKYIWDELVKRGWWLGGEASGHIICRNINTTGDGIIVALQILARMLLQDQKLSDLSRPMQKYPQIILNIPIKTSTTYNKIIKNTKFKKMYQDLEYQLQTKGRIVIRPSGTEPLIRLMVEGENQKNISSVAKQLEQAILNAI